MAFYKNGKPVISRNKYIVVKFLEDDRNVVIYVYADYPTACDHIKMDGNSKYFGKVITTQQYITENKLRWLKSLNVMYNRKCTDITVV